MVFTLSSIVDSKHLIVVVLNYTLDRNQNWRCYASLYRVTSAHKPNQNLVRAYFLSKNDSHENQLTTRQRTLRGRRHGWQSCTPGPRPGLPGDEDSSWLNESQEKTVNTIDNVFPIIDLLSLRALRTYVRFILSCGEWYDLSLRSLKIWFRVIEFIL